MKRKLLKGALWASMLTLAFSCVPGGKYNSLHDKSVEYMNERDNFKIENLDLSMKNREMEARLASVDEEVKAMEQERDSLLRDVEKSRSEVNSLNARYADLQKAQEDLIRGNVTETRRLLRELQQAQASLQGKEDILRQLEGTLETKRTELDALTYELEKRNARMVEPERILMRSRMR
ncbi:MAG: hypothetical protein R2744_10085 [Bacteroidales bacterium]